MPPARVLVVEDEALIAMMVEVAVESAGAEVAASAGNIQDALRLAASGDFDAGLLDVNLGGQKAHAVAAVLKQRKVPFAFVTGYGEAGVLPGFDDAPVLGKPFTTADIARVLAELTGA